ncbi:MAG: 50S ribosomal protein L21 [Kiloniellales bacterium]
MFAVFQTGGKQYKVAKDQVVTVERLAGEAGTPVAFETVMMVGDGDKTAVGAPYVAGATVAAEIVEQARGPRLIVFKKKRRKNHRRRNGHRQDLTLLRITEILTDGQKPSAKPAAAKKAAPKSEKAAKAEKPAKAEAPAATGAQPELLKAPEGEADDLKKITGVGPKLEEKLNDLGIYHYRQIAALTAEQAAWVDEQLKAGGRIERDDWVGQAKALAAESGES